MCYLHASSASSGIYKFRAEPKTSEGSVTVMFNQSAFSHEDAEHMLFSMLQPIWIILNTSLPVTLEFYLLLQPNQGETVLSKCRPFCRLPSALAHLPLLASRQKPEMEKKKQYK